MKNKFLLFTLIIFLFGCGQNLDTPTLPTQQVETSSTQEIKITYPDLDVINPENIRDLEEIDKWGESVVYDVAVSPDNKTIAVRTLEGIYFYNSQTLEQTGFRPYKIEDTYYRELSVSYAPDGKELILGDGSFASFINGAKNKILRLPFPNASISNVEVTTNGKFAIVIMNAGSSYCDGTGTNISILNIEGESSSQIYNKYFCHPGYVYYKITTNNKIYVWLNTLLDTSDMIEVVDLESERLIERIQYSSADINTSKIYDISSDGSLFAVKTNASGEPYTEIVDARTNVILQRVKGYVQFKDNLDGKISWQSVPYPHTEPINPNCVKDSKSLGFNPKSIYYPDEIKHNDESSTIITRFSIDLWDTKNCQIIKKIPLVFDIPFEGGAFSSDGKLFAKRWGKDIKIWDTETGEIKFTLQTSYHPNSLFSFTFDNTGGKLISIGEVPNYSDNQTSQKHILVWDSLTGKLLNKIEVRGQGKHTFNKITSSLDSNVIVVHNSTLDFYNINTGEKISSITNGLFVFESNNQIWVVPEKNAESISLYEISSGKILKTIPFSAEYVNDFILNENKSKAVLIKEGKKVVSIDIKNNRVLNEISIDGYYDSLIVYDNFFFLANRGTTIQMWDFNNGFLKEFNGFNLIDTRRNIDEFSYPQFSYENHQIIISPDKKILAVRNLQDAIRFWDISSGLFLGEVRPNIYNIRNISFSPDGQLFIVEGGNGYVYIWGVKSK